MLYLNRGDVAVRLSKSGLLRNQIRKQLKQAGYTIDLEDFDKIRDEDIAYCANSIGITDRTGYKCKKRIGDKYSTMIKEKHN